MRKLFSLMIICHLAISSLQGQCDCNVNRMIDKIDSISNVNNILLGQVIFNKSTSDLGQIWSDKSEFRFDGDFLVLNGVYYNMNKLLYFSVKKKYIEFVFQKL
jgi:hypothetical protein